jgi:hypothetical protein
LSANKMIAFESMLNVLKLGLQRIGCIRLSDGSFAIWHCPDHLIPETVIS